MKLISLNIWGGRVGDALLDFVRRHKEDTDIFCFQEVFSNGTPEQMEWFFQKDARPEIFQELSEILSSHEGYFCPIVEDIYGMATFVKKDIKVSSQDHVSLFEAGIFPDPSVPMKDHSRKMFNLLLEKDGEYLISNVHGHWVSGNKEDNENRIKQSKLISERISNESDRKIVICGDFNLLPNTKSIQMIEELGLRNLIKEFGITSTRTSLYTKKDLFADYTFVNNKVEVKKFQVLPDEVSDHAAMYIEFE